ncbi:MAG: hypothetical protein LBJ25_07195, partial [Candidatus Margulisbacteria bacterium]|nr:hypothetical protein [Candidatus Margulisiibacteriota bacterium]
LAAIGYAGTLDTNDVNARNNPALGGNPAVIAVNKKTAVEGGTLLTNAVSQSEQNKNAPNGLYGNDFTTGKDLAPSDFGAATKFLSYTGSISDSDWYSVRYNNIGNIFYSVDLKTTDLAETSLGIKNQKLSFTFTETVESISAVYGKDLGNGLSLGTELAVNIYHKNQEVAESKKAGKPLTAAYKLNSDSYLTLAVGGIYAVLPGHKISVSHKFASQRNDNISNRDHSGSVVVEGSQNEDVPAETALGYVYSVNDALEIAASYKATAGTSYDRDIDYSKGGTDTSVETSTLPNSTYGLAASYKLTPEIELQAYGTHTKGYRAAWNDINLTPDTWNKGFDFTQKGGNAQWTPTFFNGGSILFGFFNTKIVSADNGFSLDATTTLVSYSHAL